MFELLFREQWKLEPNITQTHNFSGSLNADVFFMTWRSMKNIFQNVCTLCVIVFFYVCICVRYICVSLWMFDSWFMYVLKKVLSYVCLWMCCLSGCVCECVCASECVFWNECLHHCVRICLYECFCLSVFLCVHVAVCERP